MDFDMPGSVLWKAGVTGAAPRFTAPAATWRGLPANAFDSLAFPDKGYHAAANQAPALLSAATAWSASLALP